MQSSTFLVFPVLYGPFFHYAAVPQYVSKHFCVCRRISIKNTESQKFRVYIANISLLLLLLTVSQVDVHLSHALVVKLPTYKI